jgi:uncharacterized protein DUF5670
MNKTGLIILGVSVGIAAFLLVIWLLGVISGIGGGLVHLLLILAMLVGAIGGIVGLIVALTGKKG